YGIAALSNALLNLWISYFVGRGEMRVGFLLALAVVVEATLLVSAATDAVSVARIVLLVALATQAVAILTFLVERSGQTKVALTPRCHATPLPSVVACLLRALSSEPRSR